MARYTAIGTKGTNSVQSVLIVNNTSAARFRVSESLVGRITAPSDALVVHQLARTSTDPTGTTVTLSPLDPADAAAGPTGFDGVTADGTIGAVLLSYSLHQRATFRWVAQPGHELVAPATDNNGVGAILGSGDSADYEATLFVET